MKVMSKNIRSTISSLVIVLFVSFSAFAQSNTGTITGVVQDANGAVVANASVTVKNVGTNESKTVTTDSEGRYEAPALSTGIYNVSVKASGFQAATVQNARLAVGDKLRIAGIQQANGIHTNLYLQETTGGTGSVTSAAPTMRMRSAPYRRSASGPRRSAC